MIYTTVQWTLISLILIVLIHYLFTFFQSNLTVPKVRDLVTKPTKRYNEILSTIKKEDKTSKKDNKDKKIHINSRNIETSDLKDTPEYMKNELSIFLNDLKKTKNAPQNGIDYDPISSSKLTYMVTT